MNYGDVDRRSSPSDEDRSSAIQEILSSFDIDMDDIVSAEKDIGVRYIESPYTFMFFAHCIQQARNMNRDFGDDWEEYIDEAADSCVPHQNYYLWMIWLDCGSETSDAEEMGLERVDLDTIIQVPQYELFAYARGIIYGYGRD